MVDYLKSPKITFLNIFRWFAGSRPPTLPAEKRETAARCGRLLLSFLKNSDTKSPVTLCRANFLYVDISICLDVSLLFKELFPVHDLKECHSNDNESLSQRPPFQSVNDRVALFLMHSFSISQKVKMITEHRPIF